MTAPAYGRALPRVAKFLAALLVFVAACASATPVSPIALSQQSLPHLSQPTIPLDGPWRFHPGDDLSWSSPTLDDAAWENIAVGRPWEGQGHPNLKGFAWYRKQITLAPNQPPDLNMALLLQYVESACDVYWNGRLVGSYGSLPPNAVWYWNNEPLRLIPLGPAQSGILAIRVWRAPDAYSANEDEGGLTDTPRLTTVEAGKVFVDEAKYQLLNAQLYNLILIILTVVGCVVALLAWLRNRRQWMLFWLGLYLLRPLLLLLVNLPGEPFRWSYGTIGIVFSSTDAVLWILLLYLLNLRDNPKLVRWTQAIAAFSVICQMFEGSEQFFDWERAPHFFLAADVILTIPVLLLEGYGLVLVGFALRKRLDAPRWCLAICAVLAQLYSGLFSSFGLGRRWTHWTIIDTITAGFTIGGTFFNFDTLINTALLISLLYAAWRYAREEAARQAQVKDEYRSAQAVQKGLIPEELPQIPGLTFASAYLPAGEVGGDFFQILPTPHGSAIVAIGDVSGKGMPAAMTVALLVGALRTLAQSTTSPAAILHGMNLQMLARKGEGFATCLVLLIEPTGQITVANAAHIPPYQDGEELSIGNGLPLGLSPSEEYIATSFHLDSGRQLTLMTDGVLEARNPSGELLGFDRTAALSTRSAEDIARAAQHFGQEDDITVLTIQLSLVEAVHA